MPAPPSDATAPVVSPLASPPGTVLHEHYAGCYGCGSDVPAGLHLRVTRAEGASVTGVTHLTDQHQGAPGLAHGGILAAAFDEIAGYVVTLLSMPTVTGRLEVDYLLPVPINEDLVLRAECTAVAGRKVWASVEAVLADGRIAARAAGLFITVGIEHFARHRPASVGAPVVPPRFGP